MPTNFEEQKPISPMRSFYEGLTDEQKLALAEAEGWRIAFGDQTIIMATKDLSELPFDELVEEHDYVTLLKFTTEDGATKEFGFAHENAIDLTKLKPVEYGISNDALIDEWTILEWSCAKEAAISQAISILDASSRRNIKYQYAQFGFGYPVSS